MDCKKLSESFYKYLISKSETIDNFQPFIGKTFHYASNGKEYKIIGLRYIYGSLYVLIKRVGKLFFFTDAKIISLVDFCTKMDNEIIFEE